MASEWEEPAELCRSDPTLSSPGPLKAEFISREKYKCAGRPFDNFESLDAWRADVGSLAAANRGAYRFKGSGSAELRTASGDDRVQISRRFEPGVDLSSHDLSLGAQLLAPSQEEVIVQLLAPDRENRVVFAHPIHGRWGWVRLDLGATGVEGSPDLTDVREIRIGVYSGEGRDVRLLVDSLRITPRAETGRVILTFDDNARSQYERAFPILEEHGYPAVVGVNPWDVGETSTDMTVEHLRELQSAGWDIASYPKQPETFSSYPSLEQIEKIRGAKEWLIERGFEEGARFLVWPSERFDAKSLRIASRYHYLGFTGAFCPSGQLLTGPTTITRTAMNKTPVPEIERLIGLADAYDQLLVLTAHGIGETRPMVSEAAFESILDAIAESDLAVTTASGLWETLEGSG